ncbi:MAG: glycosyltransferase family 1 protein, partial [Pseudomonadota bacterium]|nr:glycosyltransferase family 1 protein [Pseudomonadota bacterium]
MNLDGTSIWLLLDSRTMGGIETHVIQLARLLAEVGMKPSVVRLADHGPHSMDAQLDALNIPVRVLSGGLRSLFLALRTSRPDMIHTHG